VTKMQFQVISITLNEVNEPTGFKYWTVQFIIKLEILYSNI